MKTTVFITLTLLTSYNVLCNRVLWAHSGNPLGSLISGGSGLRHRRGASQPPDEDAPAAAAALPGPVVPGSGLGCAPVSEGGQAGTTQQGGGEGSRTSASSAGGKQQQQQQGDCHLPEGVLDKRGAVTVTQSDLDDRDFPGRPTNPTLRKYVPYGYDKYVRPPGEEGVNTPLVIYISVKVRDFQNIDETNMELTIEWFVRLFWKDMNLNIPTHLPDGVWDNLPPDIINYVWLPTAYIAHVREITQPFLVIVPESFRMKNDGLIRYSMAVTTRISCPMDFSAYPFDRQICFFTLESYQYDSTQVLYTWYKHIVEMGNNIHSNHFDFAFEPVGQVNSTHQHRQFPALSIRITLTRRLSSHLMNTYLPSGLFVIVSWLTFLVPPDLVPGRMVLTITTLLTLVSMFSGIKSDSPSVSYAKAVDQWMIMCMVSVFSVLVEYTFIIRLREWDKENRLKLGQQVSSLFASSLQVAPTSATQQSRDPKQGWINNKKSAGNAPAAIKTTNLSQVWSNRLEKWTPFVLCMAFLVFNFCYWAYWLGKRGTFG